LHHKVNKVFNVALLTIVPIYLNLTLLYRNSQSKVDTWTIPILENYKEEQVNYYEVPMISGSFKLASNFIDNGMRGGVPKDLHDNVATYYGKMDEYRTNLMMSDKNSCYLFLLDTAGMIRHIDESVANPQKIKNLSLALEKLNVKGS
jgi:hypothetical protein